MYISPGSCSRLAVLSMRNGVTTAVKLNRRRPRNVTVLASSDNKLSSVLLPSFSACHKLRCVHSSAEKDEVSVSVEDDVIEEVIEQLGEKGVSSPHKLEEIIGDNYLAVLTRRELLMKRQEKIRNALEGLPAKSSNFDSRGFYDIIQGSNCENVIGYLPLPVGAVGPLTVNGEEFHVPMATTEGALVASTNRGARAISLSGGATSVVVKDGMTRSPCVALDSVAKAAEFAEWIESKEQWESINKSFSSTTRFGKLKHVTAKVAGRYVFLRFEASSGDAMGMNMVGKGVNQVLTDVIERYKVPIKLISLSGNMCTDKKPSAINWTNGRGKSVVCEAVIPATVVEKVLKTTVKDLVRLNVAKNLVGSSLAGSIGGNNAHAANLVAAVFLATGQDPAQVVESANCLTQIEAVDGNDGGVVISVTMPCIEVGTLGGGTGLTAQSACLEMLGVKGTAAGNPGMNAKKLAQIIAATVLAGELSLNSALASNHLISAHMDLNRSSKHVPKKFEQGKVQPGLKKQRTSHDQDLIGSEKGPKNQFLKLIRRLYASPPRTREDVVQEEDDDMDTNRQFNTPRLPIP
mmetsp:Transcript_4415/g.5874  ORF Transcript_4415/g.5874 Transcript_4415/m.5874 type:complete len:576 (-) Transcript_4415:133-1860(-)